MLVGTEYEFMVLCKDDNGDGPFSKSLRIWTQSEEPRETNLYTGKSQPKFFNWQLHHVISDSSVKRFLFTGPAPIGYPRNVAAKPLDDGLLVTWEPPEFGMQLFKTYIIR